ncbi:MAG TPA: hypothetical protein PKC97_04140 [Burkholderiaceae bacterium]|nr:hypothetical protein [Burkholderiaceae bacterium]
MDTNFKLLPLVLSSALAVASCGGGGSSTSSVVPPNEPPSDAQRVAAATGTANSNTMCSLATLGTYYWEIGDADGVKASGSPWGGPTATTSMWIFSSSKWLYAANVVQKRGVLDVDVPFLNFTSGYSEFGNAPICPNGDTVASCKAGGDGQDPGTIGRFYYDSGHMQHHAAAVMGLGAADDVALAADLNATVGSFGFSYTVPQLAAGVVATPQAYAGFLRKVLRGELAIAVALGTHKVCTNPSMPGCNAAYSPESVSTEYWNYSLGHWVEDDPTVGDHAFSSAGGGGFYPWIDRDKTYYGILAREREVEPEAGYHSAQCGRLIRQAWMTGETVLSTVPTPE